MSEDKLIMTRDLGEGIWHATVGDFVERGRTEAEALLYLCGRLVRYAEELRPLRSMPTELESELRDRASTAEAREAELVAVAEGHRAQAAAAEAKLRRMRGETSARGKRARVSKLRAEIKQIQASMRKPSRRK
jgi:hypothetical protein